MNAKTEPIDDDEMPEDYAELLEGYDFSKAVRGKYYQRLVESGQAPIVKITNEVGDRYVVMKTIQTIASVNADGKLTLELDSELQPGEYQVALIVEQPVGPKNYR